MINGEIYNKGDIGGELGSIYLGEDKTLEILASGKTVREKSRTIFGRELNVSELIKMKENKARKIIEETSDALALGIGSLINVFNPEIVVLAGGMREAGEEFLNIIRKKSVNYIRLPSKYEIVWSKLEEPGILGAGLIVD